MIAIRNQAIKQLYYIEGISRSRISEFNLCDIDLRYNRMRFRPLRQKKKIWHTIKTETKHKIKDWLKAYNVRDKKAPLFVALDSCQYGHRLSATSINRNVVTRTI